MPRGSEARSRPRSEEHTSELQSRQYLHPIPTRPSPYPPPHEGAETSLGPLPRHRDEHPPVAEVQPADDAALEQRLVGLLHVRGSAELDCELPEEGCLGVAKLEAGLAQLVCQVMSLGGGQLGDLA